MQCYKNEEDAQAVELQTISKKNGQKRRIKIYWIKTIEDRMTKVIVEEYKKLK